MNASPIEIKDYGRGPGLPNRRITVQDLLPYYRENASNDRIRIAMPWLADDEIAAVMDFIREHFDEVVADEARIDAYYERMSAGQPRPYAHLTYEERRVMLHQKAAELKAKPAVKERLAGGSPAG